LVPDEDVLRRHVAVDDLQRAPLRVALAVRVIEPLAHLGRDVARERDGHRLLELAETIRDLEQILAPDPLHRDEVGVADLSQLEDLADVGVRQLPGDLGLIDEHLDEVAVLRHRGQDSLDRDDLLEPLDPEALRLEHLGHPAHAQALEQQIFPEGLGRPHGAEIVSYRGSGCERGSDVGRGPAAWRPQSGQGATDPGPPPPKWMDVRSRRGATPRRWTRRGAGRRAWRAQGAWPRPRWFARPRPPRSPSRSTAPCACPSVRHRSRPRTSAGRGYRTRR